MKKAQEARTPRKNVRGKRTRNPGYDPGNHWLDCDRCGCTIRKNDAMITWDDLVVCPDDWEPRHPQDFVRGRADDQSAKAPVRSEPVDTFIEVTRLPSVSTIPEGDNNNSL